MASLAAVNADFGFNLFREMDSNHGSGNVFFSSLSIFTALAVVRLGARGDCASQMDKVLHFNRISGHGNSFNAQQELQSQLNRLLSDINTSHKDYELSMANGVFAEKVFDIHEDYIKCAEKLYHARVERVDFTNAVQDSKYKMNSWVENETRGKIKNVIGDESFSSSAVMVLVNAMYFKGQWESAFPKGDTMRCPFKSPQEPFPFQRSSYVLSEVQTLSQKGGPSQREKPLVPAQIIIYPPAAELPVLKGDVTGKCPGKIVAMMYQERMFNMSVIQDPNMQILELRYHGGISMYVMLPESDLSQIENQLTFENLMKWTNPQKMSHQYVRVFLPQFKMEKDYEIKRHLKALGLRDIFEESRADLSGIASGGRLYLSKLMHKSHIEVNEDGTEAAAVSGNNIVEKLLPESAVFRADHPFLFVIRKNDIILFSGKVSCP